MLFRSVVRWWDIAPASEAELADEELAPDVTPRWAFIIVWNGRDVGFIQYYHPYPEMTWTAGIDIFIGEPDARDHGVGTEAVRVMLDYVFHVKHVHRVTIDPVAENARAIRAYEKAGFRLDRRLRHNDRRGDGTYVDTQCLSILDEEWPAARAAWLSHSQ